MWLSIALSVTLLFLFVVDGIQKDKKVEKARNKALKETQEIKREATIRHVNMIKAMPIRPFVIGLIKCIKLYVQNGDGKTFSSEAMGHPLGSWCVLDEKTEHYRITSVFIGSGEIDLNIRERSKIRHAIFYFKQAKENEKRIKIKEQQDKAIKLLESIVNQ